MKVSILQNSHNRYMVVVEQNGEKRRFSEWYSLEIAQSMEDSLLRDIARHGPSVANFDSLPLVVERRSKAGRKVYDVAQ